VLCDGKRRVCNCGVSSQTADQVGDPRSGFTRSRTKWFNTDAFAPPATGTFGTSGRNTLFGPYQSNIDVSLFKIVRFGENIRLQVRPEFSMYQSRELWLAGIDGEQPYQWNNYFRIGWPGHSAKFAAGVLMPAKGH
jgi:hypothetical protein